jgi:hypothetical protein
VKADDDEDLLVEVSVFGDRFLSPQSQQSVHSAFPYSLVCF